MAKLYSIMFVIYLYFTDNKYITVPVWNLHDKGRAIRYIQIINIYYTHIHKYLYQIQIRGSVLYNSFSIILIVIFTLNWTNALTEFAYFIVQARTSELITLIVDKLANSIVRDSCSYFIIPPLSIIWPECTPKITFMDQIVLL